MISKAVRSVGRVKLIPRLLTGPCAGLLVFAVFNPQFFVECEAASPPAGADATFTIAEDSPYTFRESDFGFTDPDDDPPHRFAGVTVASLPAAGRLSIEGSDVGVGTFVSMFPEPELNWTPREAYPYQNAIGAWRAVASSATGTTLIAVTREDIDLGRIYISSDSGATWAPREESRKWRAVACSVDGTHLVAVAAGDPIYISTDSGQTWTPRAEALNWSAVTSSADGTKLAATVEQGEIYISHDSGVTWAATGESQFWKSIASSADGARLVAADRAGWLHVSSNSGTTWLPRANNKGWLSVASSADGLKLVAAGQEPGGFPGRLYTSTDGGLTWTPREEKRVWTAVASSSDGSKLVAVTSSDRIYTSRDFGVTWQARDSARDWSCCASSADGTKLVAGTSSKLLFTSVEAVPELVFTPAKNAFASPYATFAFQVHDDAPEGPSVDPTPNAITIDVTAVNDPPSVRTPIEDQIAVEHTAFTFQIASNTFTDVESGSSLTYTARQTDDSPLPAWLSFAPETRRFSGTPGSADTGRLELKVVATDDGAPAQTGTASFALAVENVDDTPSGTDGSTYLAGRHSYTFRAANFGFSDPDDVPPNYFTRIKLTTLPATGVLTVDGIQAVAGQFAALSAAPLGSRWTPRDSSRSWKAIASSRDGTKLVAISNIGRIYTSTDAGASWTQRESAREWYAVTSDADGVNLAAVVRFGRIYTSQDSGVTWTPRAVNATWWSIDSSDDGSHLAAVGNSSRVYLSTDYGVTWTQREQSRGWYSICSSSDGSRLAAVVWNGQIFTSADSGATWSARESQRPWRAITTSSDGSKLAAIAEKGRIYTSSDFGLTWTARENNRRWQDIDSSADGATLAAVVENGRVFISRDAGVTWAPRESARDWRAITVSRDASTVAAVGNLTQIYISTPMPAQVLTYTRDPEGDAVPFTEFTFQVEDDGAPERHLDLTPNPYRLNLQESPFQIWAAENGLPSDPAANGAVNLLLFASGLTPGSGPIGELTIANGSILSRGLPSLFPDPSLENGGLSALFGRRRGSGLTYQGQFSADLTAWESTEAVPIVLADDGLIEVCSLRFPARLSNGQAPHYFRLSVSVE